MSILAVWTPDMIHQTMALASEAQTALWYIPDKQEHCIRRCLNLFAKTEPLKTGHCWFHPSVTHSDITAPMFPAPTTEAVAEREPREMLTCCSRYFLDSKVKVFIRQVNLHIIPAVSGHLPQ